MMSSEVKTASNTTLSPQGSSHVANGISQRKCICGGSLGVTGKCAACDEKQLRRTTTDLMESNEVPPIVYEVLSSPGQALDTTTRAFMEQHLGYDFSKVRVHSNAAAEQSALNINGDAYTVGHDIVFGAGRFAPGSHRGRQLIAHELAHVIQQTSHSTNTRDSATPILKILPPEHALEMESKRVAESLGVGESKVRRSYNTLHMSTSPLSIARIVRQNPFGTGPKSTTVPDLEEETVRKVTGAINAKQFQEAIDLIVRDAANSGAIDLDLINSLTAVFDPTLALEGETTDPTRDRQGGLQPAVVKIGPTAFAHGVSWLYSTIRHEYVHVQQGRPPSENQPVIVSKTAADPAAHGQEVEAYAWEILNSDATGVKGSPIQIATLWNRLRWQWIQVLPLLQRSLRDLVDRAFDKAKKIVGRSDVLKPP
ncbi:protein of unknown function [Burkholderia sp. YR290]|nr:protein of unknown function [Burkholderia sp. YR290]